MAVSIPIGGTTAAERATLAGAIQTSSYDQPLGTPRLGPDAEIRAQAIQAVRLGTAAEISVIPLLDGELAFATDTGQMLVGYNDTDGGVPFGVGNSPYMVHVYAFGTPAQNAQALSDACDKAAELALAGESSYQVWVVLWPGNYDFAGLDTIVLGGLVNIVGASLGTALIYSTDFGSTDPIITIGSGDCAVTGLYFQALTQVPIHITPGNHSRRIENLIIDSPLGSGISVEAGDYTLLTVSNVRGGPSGRPTICGGVDGANADSTVVFTECEGAGKSFFGGETAAGAGTFSGKIIRCYSASTSNNIKLAGMVYHSRFSAAINRLVSGAKIWDCMFSVDAAALTNNSTAVSIYADGNRCRSTLLGTNVTNSVSSPSNRESIGVALW